MIRRKDWWTSGAEAAAICRITSWVCSYDAQGPLTGTGYHQGAGDELFERTEVKDAVDGKTVNVFSYDSESELTGSQVRTLDSAGRIARAETSHRDWKVRQFGKARRVAFRYDANGRVIEQITEPHDIGSSSYEHSVPPGTVRVAYDGTQHSRRIRYTNGGESLGSTARLEDSGAIVSLAISANGTDRGGMELECKYGTHGNWTECRRWAVWGGTRKMTARWQRDVTYR